MGCLTKLRLFYVASIICLSIKDVVLLPSKHQNSHEKHYVAKDSSNNKLNGSTAVVDKSDESVLMPSTELKNQLCFMVPFNQTIEHPGCKKVQLQNNYCRGQCNSFFVPNGDDLFRVCSFCRPSEFEQMKIVLDCKNSKYAIKMFFLIKKCSCDDQKC